MKEWDAIDRFFDTLPAIVRGAGEDAGKPVARFLEARARETTLYNDLSGATRTSTVAYVAGGDEQRIDDHGSVAQQVYDDALARGVVEWPAFVDIEEVEPEGGDDATTVVLTALMSYDDHLVTMQGGARDFLGATLSDADAAALIWVSGLREAFKE